ncbi:ribose-5-phosphate isomerase A, partial [Francisella tularensis subsp. holarctica]|uniref:ribose-5-phosphate isomerase A n=1 Tax=Francisella tularensis TaxID=263 RepID=UPI0023819C49
KALGFDVVDLNYAGEIDLYFDGADECNNHKELIKGGGAALTREKICVAAAKKFICIIDESKIVNTLGNFTLPIEVIQIARSYIA